MRQDPPVRGGAIARGMPPRQRAALLLKRLIEDGSLASDSDVPSARALSRLLRIPAATVHRAIVDLEAAGILESRPGGVRRVLGAGGIVRDFDRAGGMERFRGAIAVLMHDDADPAALDAPGWSSQVLVGALERIAEVRHRAVLVHMGRLRPNDVRLLIAAEPLGVVLPDLEMDIPAHRRLIAELQAARVPLTMVAEQPEFAHVDRLCSDHHHGAGLQVEWLAGRGRRRLLQMLPDPPGSAWPHHRRTGCLAALHRLGLEALPLCRFDEPTGLPADRMRAFAMKVDLMLGALHRHLSRFPGIDGILVASDGIVLSCAAALRHLGRTPGRDIDIIGYDNYIDEAAERDLEVFRPAATIDKGNHLLGSRLVDLLLRRVGGGLPAAPVLEHSRPLLVAVGGKASGLRTDR